MIRFYLTTLQSFALAITIATSCAAQEFESSTENPEVELQQILAKYKIPPNSKHMARLRQEMRSPDKDDDGDSDGREPRRGAVTPPELAVVKHLRGQQGLPFNREYKRPEIKPFKEEDLKVLAEKAVEIGEMYTESMFRGQDLEPCAEDKTERVQLDINDKNLNKLALVDTLFIDAKDVPPNAKAIFGENVDVRSYAKHPGNAAYYSAFGYGVTCLPTRVIITGRQTIRHMGEPALRNYDNNPNGKGAKVKENEK